MNSKIRKNKRAINNVTLVEDKASGSFLAQKLEAWCEAEPSVLMWEVSFIQGSVKQFINNSGRETDIPGNWSIEFNIVRANATSSTKGFFNGAFVLGGRIKKTFEIVGGANQEAYLLSLDSESFRGEQPFLTSRILWDRLISLGMNAKSSESST